MNHCTRCRADAVGLSGRGQIRPDGRLPELLFQSCPNPTKRHAALSWPWPQGKACWSTCTWDRPPASRYGGLPGPGFEFIEERNAPPTGGGEKRWNTLAEILDDCRHVLVSGVGESPRQILTGCGVEPLEVSGFIEEALKAIYAGDDLSAMRVRKGKACCVGKTGQGGGGMGCM